MPVQDICMAKYVCMTCGYVYDEEKGAAPDVPAGTPFDKVPESWVCPMCGASKKFPMCGASKKFFVKRG